MSGLCHSYVAVKLIKTYNIAFTFSFFLLRIKHAISPICLLPSGSSQVGEKRQGNQQFWDSVVRGLIEVCAGYCGGRESMKST